ncbi:MAG: hypothetical protein K6G50_01955 [bacterium]|nr:hypothetical protein [bacterium]
MSDSENNTSGLRNDLEALRQSAEECLKKEEELSKSRSELEQAFNAKLSESEEKIRGISEQLTEAITSFFSFEKEMKEKLEENQSQFIASREESKNFFELAELSFAEAGTALLEKDSLTERVKELEGLQQEKESLAERVKELEGLQQEKESLAERVNELEGLQQEKESLALRVKELEGQQVKESSADRETELEDLHQEKELLTERVKELEAALSDSENEIVALKAAQEADADLNKEDESAAINAILVSVQEENAALSNALTALRETNVRLGAENVRLSEENAKLSDALNKAEENLVLPDPVKEVPEPGTNDDWRSDLQSALAENSTPNKDFSEDQFADLLWNSETAQKQLADTSELKDKKVRRSCGEMPAVSSFANEVTERPRSKAPDLSSKKGDVIAEPISLRSKDEISDDNLEWHPSGEMAAASAKKAASSRISLDDYSQPDKTQPAAKDDFDEDDLEWHPSSEMQAVSPKKDEPAQNVAVQADSQPAPAEKAPAVDFDEDDLEWHPSSEMQSVSAKKSSTSEGGSANDAPVSQSAGDDAEVSVNASAEGTGNEDDFEDAFATDAAALLAGSSSEFEAEIGEPVEEESLKEALEAAEEKEQAEVETETEAEASKPEESSQDIAPVSEAASIAKALGAAITEAGAPSAEDKPKADNWIVKVSSADKKAPVSSKSCACLPPPESFRHLVLTEDETILQTIASARAKLEAEDCDAAWEVFSQLAAEHPDVLQVQKGLFDCYFMSQCWNEAYDIGRRIRYDMMDQPDWKDFAGKLHIVMMEYLKSVRDLGERKRIYLSLAELHLDQGQVALECLKEAAGIPGEMPENARIHYYIVRLSDSTKDYDVNDVLSALQYIDTQPELFKDLVSIANDDRFRGHLPVVNFLEAMFTGNRRKAKEMELECDVKVPVGPSDLTPAHIEEIHDDEADMVVEFLLNQLFSRTEMPAAKNSQRIVGIIKDSVPVPFGFTPFNIFERFNRRLFRFNHYDTMYYEGNEPTWFDVATEERDIFIFNKKLKDLPAPEQQFIILRKMFQVHHKHLQIWRSRSVLTDDLRCRLVQITNDIVKETGTDISATLEKEIMALDGSSANCQQAIDVLLDKLYRHSLRPEFMILKEYLFAHKPFSVKLDGATNRFAAKYVGLTEASYALARLLINDASLYERIEKEGFKVLYESKDSKYKGLRLYLQRLWSAPFTDDLWTS